MYIGIGPCLLDNPCGLRYVTILFYSVLRYYPWCCCFAYTDPMSKKVYISSTFEDLEHLREKAIEAVLMHELLPIGMEYYAVSETRPLDKCLEDVRRCDIYIGIVAFRFGYVPPNQSHSITRLEYEEAGKHDIPRLMFVISEQAGWPTAMVDKDREAIDTFRADVLREHVSRPLENLGDFKNAVYVALDKQLEKLADRKPTPAYQAMPRADTVEFPPLLPYLSDRSRQRDQLKTLLSRECMQNLHCTPLVCIVHGHEAECHYEFLQKVRSVMLPELLGLPESHDSVRVERIRWPSAGGSAGERMNLYCRYLAKELAHVHSTDIETIIEGLNNNRCPVLLYSETMTEDWSREEETFIEHWLNFWNTLPNLVQGQRLFVFLSVKHSASEQASRRWFSSTPQRKARKYLQRVDYDCRPGIRGRVLDELSAVPYNDLSDWMDDFVHDYCPTEDLRLEVRQTLRRNLRTLYDNTDTGHFRMEDLGEALKGLLDDLKTQYPLRVTA